MPASPAASTSASNVSSADNNSSSSNNATSSVPDEEQLRQQLRQQLQQVTRREPLEMTYKFLLTNGVVTPRKPLLTRDKLYAKPITARLRTRVEAFAAKHSHPWDKVAQRQEIDDGALRAAVTLRENKKHEQEALLKATMRHMNATRRDPALLEGMALGLQQKEWKLQKQKEESRQNQEKLMLLKQQLKEKEKQERLNEQRMRREAARKEREWMMSTRDGGDGDEDLMHKKFSNSSDLHSPTGLGSGHTSAPGSGSAAGSAATPQQRLVKYMKPVFAKLWDMEFANIGNTNPFRIVIDKSNCAAMGLADYCQIVKKPMNLTYIRENMEQARYESLQQFFADVELMIQNALLYNSDQNNDYHLAAKEMHVLFKKVAGALVKKLKGMQKQQQQNNKK